ncbi:hypothetical protein ACHAXT_008104 [Thalassiosira profunda]
MAVDVVLAFVWGALYVLERWDLLEGAGSRGGVVGDAEAGRMVVDVDEIMGFVEESVAYVESVAYAERIDSPLATPGSSAPGPE